MVSPHRVTVWSLVILLAGGVIGWATAVVTRPPQQVATEANFVLVSAENGEVGQSMSTVVTARWPARRVAVNQSTGTVTRLPVTRGERVDAGDVLYRVDERPVVVLKGAVPAFRPLSAGAVGADVTQLTRFLAAKNYLDAATSTYSPAVQRAVRAWQRSMGVEQTGRLNRGDVIFVKSLPVRVALDPRFAVGALLSAGAPAIEALSSAPTFTAQYSDFQAKQISEGMPVEIESRSSRWSGALGVPSVAADGTVTAAVVPTDDDALCGKQCKEVPLRGTLQMKGTTEVQKTLRGVVVPSAALVTDSDGSTAVITADGQRSKVTVRGRARGMAVIDGLAAGTAVRVPGQ